MSTAEIVEQLKHLSNPERLAIIEAASNLVRGDLLAHDEADGRLARNERLRAAALAAKDLYESEGELTEWTCLDVEDSKGHNS
jgi:hypothetical protein